MRNAGRDPTLLVMLFVPVLMILVTRFGVPPLAEAWPVVVDYYPIIVVFFCVITAMMPAYIVSFMLLDEKDQGVLTAYRIMPITPEGFFGMRMLFMFVFDLTGSFLLLQMNGLVAVPVFKSIIVSVVCAACSPFFVFLTVSVAKNKIEGATIMKVLNVLLMLPLISLFVDSPLTYILGVIPFYWIYEGFEVVNNSSRFFIYFGIGLITAMVNNYIFYRFALKRFYFK